MTKKIGIKKAQTWLRPKLGRAIAVLLLFAVPVLGSELTVERFVTVTIARLELAEVTWAELGRGPTEAEEDDLFEIFGTISENYYQFSGKHSEEIESYLDDQPELRETIEALSQRIRLLIEQREVG